MNNRIAVTLLAAPLGGFFMSAYGQASSGLPDPTAIHQAPPVSYMVWNAFNSTNFSGTATAGIGSPFSPLVPVSIQSVNVALAVTPQGCTTPGMLDLYDETSGTPVEVSSQFQMTLVNGQYLYTYVPPTPYTLSANHVYLWGIKTATAGCTTAPAAPSIATGYTVTATDLTVAPSGGGTTVVADYTGITDTTANEKAPCFKPSCNPGGTNAPASYSLTAGTISGSPTADTLGLTISQTTAATSTQTNGLYVNRLPACDSCTTIEHKGWMKMDPNCSSAERDMAIFDSTHGYLDMHGLQFNWSTSRWQIDNEVDSWRDALQNNVAGAYITGSYVSGDWVYVDYKGHRILGDTSCQIPTASGTGTQPGPCTYFDSLTLQKGTGGTPTTYPLNMVMRQELLPSGWNSGVFAQDQLDIGSTSGTAKTCTMVYNAEEIIVSK